ncbi:LuxR C-terminal-related transcriptional regulator [Streptomyces sp. NPDC001848]|uniref:helix-turn-helix transcriptional regulator n=1 Tax=Streptomyces sp. NPDC001848 TaxID=3364618 RepID=UPI0036ADC0C5
MRRSAVEAPAWERPGAADRFHLASVPEAPAMRAVGGGEDRDALPVTLTLTASDVLTEEGAQAYLRGASGVRVVPWEDRHGADVALVLAHKVTLATFKRIEEVTGPNQGRGLPVLLAVDSISERHLLYAVDRGVVGVLLRGEVGYADIVRASRRALQGESPLPPTLVRALVERLRSLPAHQPGSSELSAREVDVLRLLAEGLSTAEVAGRLNYSERTIKNVLHDVITRLGLRNRTQAVAYAIRNGAL